MKTITMLILLICLLHPGVFGQNSEKGTAVRNFRFGIMGGIPVKGKNSTAHEMAPVDGIIAGFDLGYSFSPKIEGFSIRFQPHWSEFARDTEEGVGSQVYSHVTWKSGYVNLPFLARYTLNTGRLRPFIEAGPNLRFRTALNLKNEFSRCGVVGCSGGTISTNLQREATKDLFGVIAGIGVELDIWKMTIPVSIRVDEGLGTFRMKEARQDISFHENLKTGSIQIVAGINF